MLLFCLNIISFQALAFDLEPKQLKNLSTKKYKTVWITAEWIYHS